jgi:hypothetical protein
MRKYAVASTHQQIANLGPLCVSHDPRDLEQTGCGLCTAVAVEGLQGARYAGCWLAGRKGRNQKVPMDCAAQEIQQDKCKEKVPVDLSP